MAEIKFNINPWYAPIPRTWEDIAAGFKYNDTPVYQDEKGLEVYEMIGLGDDTFQLGHYYELRWINKDGAPEIRWIFFQDGAVPTEGVNGLTNEALLAIVIHRTETINAKFPCTENELALQYMRRALELFNERTAKRKARGVEGTLVK
jgi:hypothetical protein